MKGDNRPQICGGDALDIEKEAARGEFGLKRLKTEKKELKVERKIERNETPLLVERK